jgi:hypothetical protein
MNGHTSIPPRHFQAASIQLNDFKQICSRTVDTSTYPLACAVERNIPIYDLGALNAALTSATTLQLQDEWHHILHTGPGVFVLRDMYSPVRYSHVLSAANAAFDRIIARERESNTSQGDHFAASGSNDRI